MAETTWTVLLSRTQRLRLSELLRSNGHKTAKTPSEAKCLLGILRAIEFADEANIFVPPAELMEQAPFNEWRLARQRWSERTKGTLEGTALTVMQAMTISRIYDVALADGGMTVLGMEILEEAMQRIACIIADVESPTAHKVKGHLRAVTDERDTAAEVPGAKAAAAGGDEGDSE